MCHVGGRRPPHRVQRAFGPDRRRGRGHSGTLTTRRVPFEEEMFVRAVGADHLLMAFGGGELDESPPEPDQEVSGPNFIFYKCHVDETTAVFETFFEFLRSRESGEFVCRIMLPKSCRRGQTTIFQNRCCVVLHSYETSGKSKTRLGENSCPDLRLRTNRSIL